MAAATVKKKPCLLRDRPRPQRIETTTELYIPESQQICETSRDFSGWIVAAGHLSDGLCLLPLAVAG